MPIFPGTAVSVFCNLTETSFVRVPPGLFLIQVSQISTLHFLYLSLTKDCIICLIRSTKHPKSDVSSARLYVRARMCVRVTINVIYCMRMYEDNVTQHISNGSFPDKIMWLAGKWTCLIGPSRGMWNCTAESEAFPGEWPLSCLASAYTKHSLQITLPIQCHSTW